MTTKLDWHISKTPTTGRVVAIWDEGCGYWAAIPQTMTLQDAAFAFAVGYDHHDYVGSISCNATLFVDGVEIESLDFTLADSE